MQIHDRFAARFHDAGDVIEATDRHAQVQFGEERVQEVGEAFGAAIGQGVCVGPADSVARLASAITASVVSRTPESNMAGAERAAVRTWAVLTREHPRGGLRLSARPRHDYAM